MEISFLFGPTVDLGSSSQGRVGSEPTQIVVAPPSSDAS
jgi:hypothetical protein